MLTTTFLRRFSFSLRHIPEPISAQRYEVIILKIGHLEVKVVVSDLNARPKNRTITRTTAVVSYLNARPKNRTITRTPRHQPSKEASLFLLLDSIRRRNAKFWNAPLCTGQRIGKVNRKQMPHLSQVAPKKCYAIFTEIVTLLLSFERCGVSLLSHLG